MRCSAVHCSASYGPWTMMTQSVLTNECAQACAWLDVSGSGLYPIGGTHIFRKIRDFSRFSRKSVNKKYVVYLILIFSKIYQFPKNRKLSRF